MAFSSKAALSLAASLLAITASGAATAQTTQPDPRIEALERQIEALRAEVNTLKAERAAPAPVAAPAAAPVATAQTASAPAATPAAPKDSVKFSPSPQWTSADKAFSFKVRGRIELDTAFFDVRRGTRDFNNGTEIRRARLGVDGKMFTDWAYRLEADVAAGSRDDSSGSELDVKDAYIQYNGFENLSITAGQHKTPNGLDQLTSSTNLTFMERASFSEAFLDRRNAGGDFKLGLSARYAQDVWSLTLGVFGENAAVTGNSGADEGYGFHGRATVAPVNTDENLIHLGVSGFWRDTGGRETVRFGDRPEVRVDGTRLVDTSAFDASSYTFLGAELIGATGPFFVQAEYGRTDVNRTGGLGDVSFDGGYVQAGWFLTGERLPYKDGVLGRVEPKRNFSVKDGGAGAFQLAARYSALGLNDGTIQGGRSENLTVGLNWYANPYIRVLVNWVRFDTTRRGIETDGDAFATRFAVNW
ncbi:MAG TPA: porin [Pedomonas sp.]|uniref:OprO/OprP family phosphate-selective porin n=1 Tax=Pedomonas sp. TaxID=2976421 RepID=UPI002F409ED9